MAGISRGDSGTGLPCFIHDLPEESVVHIFSFLDIIDRTNLKAVCKRWADISGDPRLQKIVILDLTKWETHHPRALLPRTPRLDARSQRDTDNVEKEWRRRLLQRFWTPRTRHVIFRRPPGTAAPSESWGKVSIRGEVAELAVYWRYYWSDIHVALKNIAGLLRTVPAGGEHEARQCMVTFQNIHMLTNDLRDFLPRYVDTVHLKNVHLRCYFYTGVFHPLDKPPQVTRTVLVEKAVVVRGPSGAWPWAKEPFYTTFPGIRHRQLEFFSRFLPNSLTAAEVSFLEDKLQSPEPIGWTLSRFLTNNSCTCWKLDRRSVRLLGNEDIHPGTSISSLGLTVKRIGSFPRWLQYLMVELLKDPSIEIVPTQWDAS
ncbi:uncharacterized protein LOC129600745 [Paramacrobiotus metropolitanus]|uniref:uncharacterized protein LOC129600745 n=1 Tax=Paramacrobiotus metropolitanus TaxID=2943436 RepID=UPI002445E36E|nr:uncharacterized protein LOC129600745 [Paramacrobiotus metropolitanus]